MENFILNLANGWTLIDLILISTFAYLWISASGKLKRKESVLYFSDIEKKQIKAEKQKLVDEISILTAKNAQLQISFDKKSAMLSRCIDRPKINGLFVKKDYKPIIAYKAKENVYNSDGIKIFYSGLSYTKIKAKIPTLFGEDGKKYIIDTRKFHLVY